jgi:uncharacterized protein DUF4202
LTPASARVVPAPGENARELGRSIQGVGVIADPRAPAPIAELAALRREFPHLPWVGMADVPPGAVLISATEWRDTPQHLYGWDACVLRLQARPDWLVLAAGARGDTFHQAALEIFTRYQRLAPRINEFSRDAAFRRALSKHRELHDLGKSLVRADYDHALDVWQWTLRLNPRASRALQLAALFHDIERLWTEADQRIEQHASDYQAFKDAHARGGAAHADQVLTQVGIGHADRLEVEWLIVQHERPFHGTRDGDLATLADADALSFFALNSPGFADYYGPEHTRRKIKYSIGRMTARAVQRLTQVQLRPDIRRYLAETSVAGPLGAAQESSP